MKMTPKTLLALFAVALAAPLSGQETELSCRDFRPTQEAIERFPNLAGACEGVVDRDGELYGRFVAKVKRVKGPRVTLYLPATDRTVTVRPDPSLRVSVGGRMTNPRDLQPGQELRFYINLKEFAKPDIEEVSFVDEQKFFVSTKAAVTPGRIYTSVVQRVAIVEAVDQETRELKLIDSDGNRYTLVATDLVQNLHLIEARDRIVVEHLESVAFLVVPEGTGELPDVAAVEIGPKDGKPNLRVVDTFMVKATLESLNRSDHIAVLRGEDGRTRTVKLDDDVQLGLIRVGDDVRMRVTEAVAVSVRKADKG